MVYSVFYALSPGAVIWVYVGEVFPNAMRSKGQGVGNASHWIMNTAIALGFPVVVHRMTWLCFWFVPTKGQSPERLQRRLVSGS